MLVLVEPYFIWVENGTFCWLSTSPNPFCPHPFPLHHYFLLLFDNVLSVHFRRITERGGNVHIYFRVLSFKLFFHCEAFSLSFMQAYFQSSSCMMLDGEMEKLMIFRWWIMRFIVVESNFPRIKKILILILVFWCRSDLLILFSQLHHQIRFLTAI